MLRYLNEQNERWQTFNTSEYFAVAHTKMMESISD
jgi:hypothetical protein